MTIHIHNMRKKMSKFILFIIITFVLPVYGQEGINVSSEQKSSPQEIAEPNKNPGVDILLLDNELSLLYSRGPYLVYDCQSRHWVCTGKNEVERCKNAREFSIVENEVNLPCAVIKVFEDEKSCQKKQQIVIDGALENRFCMHPERREQIKSY
jgi:hypothetical protein